MELLQVPLRQSVRTAHAHRHPLDVVEHHRARDGARSYHDVLGERVEHRLQRPIEGQRGRNPRERVALAPPLFGFREQPCVLHRHGGLVRHRREDRREVRREGARQAPAWKVLSVPRNSSWYSSGVTTDDSHCASRRYDWMLAGSGESSICARASRSTIGRRLSATIPAGETPLARTASPTACVNPTGNPDEPQDVSRNGSPLSCRVMEAASAPVASRTSAAISASVRFIGWSSVSCEAMRASASVSRSRRPRWSNSSAFWIATAAWLANAVASRTCSGRKASTSPAATP